MIDFRQYFDPFTRDFIQPSPKRHSEAEEKNIYVDADTRIQVLETMLMLPQADREQCAAFIVSILGSCLLVSISPKISVMNA